MIAAYAFRIEETSITIKFDLVKQEMDKAYDQGYGRRMVRRPFAV